MCQYSLFCRARKVFRYISLSCAACFFSSLFVCWCFRRRRRIVVVPNFIVNCQFENICFHLYALLRLCRKIQYRILIDLSKKNWKKRRKRKKNSKKYFSVQWMADFFLFNFITSRLAIYIRLTTHFLKSNSKSERKTQSTWENIYILFKRRRTHTELTRLLYLFSVFLACSGFEWHPVIAALCHISFVLCYYYCFFFSRFFSFFFVHSLHISFTMPFDGVFLFS